MSLKHVVSLSLFALALSLSSAVLAQEARFEPADCRFPIPPGADVTCGFVVVPEDHQGNPQDTIKLYTAIYRSRSANPKPDPIIFLQGGPGGAIVAGFAASYARFIEPLTAERDMIVFDQRGTGFSEPALSCPEYNPVNDAVYSGQLSADEIAEPTIEAVRACSERLQNEEGVNPQAYTSAQNAADVAALASVLGYEKVNLYGGSYGTRLAQTVMRDYPELVRSVVLDGVIALENNIFTEQASKSQDALDRLFAACAADSACAAAYPDLEQVFVQTVEALDEQPLSLTLIIPNKGQVDVTVTPEVFMGALFFSFQSSDLVAKAPQVIYEVSQGDPSSLRDALTVTLLIGEGINLGKFLAVNCHEEAYATTAEAMDASLEAYPLTGRLARLSLGGSGQAMLDTCAAWGAKPFDPREVEPVRSDVPALIFSGEFDSATPPIWAEQVAKNLSNSTSIILPAKGHVETLGGGCPIAIASAFLDDPQAPVDTSCVEDMPNIVFTGAGEAPAQEVVFRELNEAGVKGVVPEGWTAIAEGVYARGQSMSDVTLLITQAADFAISDAVQLVSEQFSLEQVEQVGEREANGVIWTLFQADGEVASVPIKADLAIVEAPKATLIAVLVSLAEERDALRETVFLPVVDALRSVAD
ncbi:MAG: alpha/beta hydrolase [Anaerolineae bacterium]|nr:alpha/beta hydrolase [Anaerolineae bacterium]MDW8172706.1 alpha/beta fold hydrolase [Anaerolineae bacterium]